jgi:hypothetical protein
MPMWTTMVRTTSLGSTPPLSTSKFDGFRCGLFTERNNVEDTSNSFKCFLYSTYVNVGEITTANIARNKSFNQNYTVYRMYPVL